MFRTTRIRKLPCAREPETIPLFLINLYLFHHSSHSHILRQNVTFFLLKPSSVGTRPVLPVIFILRGLSNITNLYLYLFPRKSPIISSVVSFHLTSLHITYLHLFLQLMKTNTHLRHLYSPLLFPSRCYGKSSTLQLSVVIHDGSFRRHSLDV